LITLLAALVMQNPAQNPGPPVNPAALVGKMLAFYNDAKSLTGRITLTQSANGVSGTVETFLQFEAPNKLYIRQQKSTGDRPVYLVVSNGKRFAYDSPIRDGKRLVEEVNPDPRVVFTYREIYAAASAGLADRSTPLDIAIGRREDLAFLRNQWATVTHKGMAKYGEESVHVISGDWRPYREANAEGQYRMYITETGELRQFALAETIRPAGGQPIQAMSTWNVKLTKNGKPDPALFNTVR
jgi:hypothetical protein